MSDVKYSVEVEFLSNGALDKPGAGLDNLLGKIHGVENAFAKVGGGFLQGIDNALSSATSFVANTVGALAASAAMTFGTGFAAAIKEGLDFNAEIEGKINGIASTMAMLGDIPMDQGLRIAADLTEQVRKDAAQLPGEFKDAMNVLSAITPATLNAGQSMDRARWLATHGVAAAAALNVPQHVAARELGDLLAGRAKSSQPLTNRLGIHATEWNKLDSNTRFEKVEELFRRLDPAMKRFAGSWAGLTSTARDDARNVARTFAAPLFGSIKGELSRGLEWFGQNEDAVNAWATNLGVAVDRAFHWGLEKINLWYPAAKTFGTHLYESFEHAFGIAAPYLHKLESLSIKFLEDPQAIEKLGHAATTLASLKVGTSVASYGASAFGEGGVAAGLGAEGALATGGALLVLAAAADGATHALLDSSSMFHQAASEQAAGLSEWSANAMTELNKFTTNMQPTLDMLGTGLLWAGKELTIGFGAALHALNSWNETLAESALWVRAQFGLLRADKALEINRPAEYNGIAVKALDAGAAGIAAFEKREAKVPRVQVTNHNTVHMSIQTNADPNRIAVALTDKLDALAQRQRIKPDWMRR